LQDIRLSITTPHLHIKQSSQLIIQEVGPLRNSSKHDLEGEDIQTYDTPLTGKYYICFMMKRKVAINKIHICSQAIFKKTVC